MAAPTRLDIFKAIVPSLFQWVYYNDTTFSALSYSQDDQMFAISFTNGSVRIFRKQNIESMFNLVEDFDDDSE